MSEWLEQLPEQLRDAPFIGKAESLEDAVGKLAHAATLVGTSLRIPGEEASDDDKKAFYQKLVEVPGVALMPDGEDEDGTRTLLTKLGMPEEHTGYKLPELEGFEWDEKMGEDLRKYAFESQLTVRQFNKLANQIAKQEHEAELTSATDAEALQRELRQDWGDTLEDRRAMIRGYLEHSDAPEDLREQFEAKNLTLGTMNWLHAVAKQFKGELKPISEDGKGGPTDMTPGTAATRLNELLNQLVGMSPMDPRYQPLMKERMDCQHALAKAGNAA